MEYVTTESKAREIEEEVKEALIVCAEMLHKVHLYRNTSSPPGDNRNKIGSAYMKVIQALEDMS